MKTAFTADDDLVARAEAKARARGTTLEEIGREWLQAFAQPDASNAAWGRRDTNSAPAERQARWAALMKSMAGHTSTGPYTRDEMNER